MLSVSEHSYSYDTHTHMLKLNTITRVDSQLVVSLVYPRQLESPSVLVVEGITLLT